MGWLMGGGMFREVRREEKRSPGLGRQFHVGILEDYSGSFNWNELLNLQHFVITEHFVTLFWEQLEFESITLILMILKPQISRNITIIADVLTILGVIHM